MERKLAHFTTEETLSAEVAKFILANDQQGAFEYLNSHFNEEIVDAAQNQSEFIYSLETLIKKRISICRSTRELEWICQNN